MISIVDTFFLSGRYNEAFDGTPTVIDYVDVWFYSLNISYILTILTQIRASLEIYIR